MSIIKVPNLGDGIQSATVLSILVQVGDSISVDQTVLELETDKATAPVPATEAGTITKILIKEGDTVATGSPIFEIGGSVSAEASPAAAPQSAPVPQPQAQAQPIAIPTLQPLASAAPLALPTATGEIPPASPSVRKISQDLGIDLRLVPSSTPGGRITMDDLRAFITRVIALAYSQPSSAPAAAAAPAQVVEAPLPDFSKWGPIEKKTASSLRKKIGQKMVDAWTKVPHVTQFEEIDITRLMALRSQYNPEFKAQGLNLTLTVFALKAIVDSLKAFPIFNSSYDSTTNEVITKNYYNIGIAVDTENGLIVPVVKNVDQKSIKELCKDLGTLAEKARTRQIGIEDLQGGTFTISNLGGLGVAQFTPIINTPEVAILALSAGKKQPVVVEDKIEPRLIMPISISYDHRIIDGADGARFTRHFIDTLNQFDEALLKG
jgi:pyruvate dehydrogenase E2 component (dihydrolipoamide acetyltransferase)